MRHRSLALVIALTLGLGVSTWGCSSALDRVTEAIKKAGEARANRMRSNGYGERSPVTVKKQLANGLTLVVQENFGAPVVAVQVWVNVGSADETDSQAGLAHLVEHMVFKGTTKRGVGEVAVDVESLGGDLNAYTSYDRTVYHITIASRYYEQATEILSDLVGNAVINPEELSREKEVVLEEIRRGKDNPRSRIYKYLFAQAYQSHNYRRPVIGFEETVSSFKRDDVMGFYKKWYEPGNMTVIVSGKVDAQKVAKAVGRYFGDMPGDKDSAGNPSPRSEKEPPQLSSREEVYREEVSEGYMYMGFHIPPFAGDDIPALDLFSVILGGGETSRLVYRVRTERRLVNKIWAYAYTPRDPGMFLLGCDLPESKAEEALDMILKQIYLIKHEPIEEWELEKAKLIIETDSIYSSETVDGQARRVGFFYSLTGDVDYEQIYTQKIKAVTREDIQRVAQKYFVGRNLSAVAIMPENSGKRSNKKQFTESKMHWIIQDVDHWDLSYKPGQLAEPDPMTAPEIPEGEDVGPLSEGVPAVSPPVKFVLDNGIRLIVRENHSVPLVAVRAAFEGGLRRESPETNGIGNFIAETITEGTAHYTASQIHSMVEARAGSIAGFSGRNSMGVTLEVPSPYFNSCLPLFADVIRYPTFPDEEVERRRGIIISSIKSQLDQPRLLAMRLFRSELFHQHPFGMNVLGTEASVGQISREDLMNNYQSFAVPANMVIAVVGDVRADKVKAKMEELFKDWVAEPYEALPPARELPPSEYREVVECRDVNQTNIVIGFQGTSITSEDRYSIAVLNSVLSGMSGRLFTKLRGKQSLAYSVYAFSEEGLDPGLLAVYIGTAPEKEETSRESLMAELKRIRGEPVSTEELNRAREVLVGDFEIGLQRFHTQAAHYALDELYGLGFRESERYDEKIGAVSKDQVLQAANKYIKPESRVAAVVRPCGPQAGLDTGAGHGEGPSGLSK